MACDRRLSCCRTVFNRLAPRMAAIVSNWRREVGSCILLDGPRRASLTTGGEGHRKTDRASRLGRIRGCANPRPRGCSRGISGPSEEPTALLLAWRGGDAAAIDQLVSVVYDELRRIARRHMRHEAGDHTLQASALVNEAYLRLIEITQVQWQNRVHFFAMASRIMRRILVDAARAKAYQKRGGGAQRSQSMRRWGRGARSKLCRVGRCLERAWKRWTVGAVGSWRCAFSGLSVERQRRRCGVSTHGDARLAAGEGMVGAGTACVRTSWTLTATRRSNACITRHGLAGQKSGRAFSAKRAEGMPPPPRSSR